VPQGQEIVSILRRHGTPYFFSKIIPGLFGLAAVPIFARLYGFEGYGQIMLLLALGNFITVFSGGWLCQSWIRFQMTWVEKRQLFKAGFLSTAVAAIILVCIFFILGLIKHDNWNPTFAQFYPVIFMTIGMLFYYVIHGGLQSALRSKQVLIISVLSSVLSLLFPIITFLFTEDINGFILSYGLAYFIAAALGMFLFPHKHLSSHSSNSDLNHWIQYGAPLSIWLALQALIPFIDRIIIQLYLGSDMVGKYSALSELVMRGFSLILFPMTMAIQPIMIRYWNTNHQSKAITLWHQVLKLIGIIFLLIGIIYLLINDWGLIIINKLLGASHQYSSTLVLLVLLSGFFWQANLLIHKPLELVKKTTLMTVYLITALMILVMISIYSIAEFGLLGVATASLMAAMVYCALSLFKGINIFKQKMYSIK